jgi:hypothetical protein
MDGFLMRPQESGWSKNGQPGATGEILRIPSDNGLGVIVFSLPKKHRVAEGHFLGDIGCHFRNENASPSFAIMGPQPEDL